MGCLRDDVFVSALVIHVSGLVCLTTDSAHGEVFVVAFTTHVGEVAIVGVDRNRRACPPRWAKSLWLSLRPSMNPSLLKLAWMQARGMVASRTFGEELLTL